MTAAPASTTEIKGSRGKLALLLLAGVVMTAGCVWILTLDLHPGESFKSFKALAAAYIGTPFFGAATLIALRRLITAGRTVVTITSTGITDTRVAAREIPWNAVENVGTWSYRRQKAVVLKVPAAIEAQIGLTRIARWSRRANTSLGADGLCITAQGLQTDFQSLYDTIVARVEQARHSADGLRV